MWHGRASLLARAEKFLGLADLGALEVAHLGRHAGDARRDERKGRHVFRVAVALDDLGAHRVHLEAQAAADGFLHIGRDVGAGANGPGYLAHPDGLPRAFHSFLGSFELGEPAGDFEAQSGRLGVDSVRSARDGGAAVLEGAPPEGVLELREGVDDEPGRRDQLKGEPGVEYIAARQAQVDEAGGGPHVFRDVREEGDNVVFCHPLDLADASGVESRFRADRLDGVGGYLAAGGEFLAHGDFDIDHALELFFFLPNSAHLGPGVAWNHGWSSPLS